MKKIGYLLIATLIFALSLSGIGNVFADKFDAGNDYKIVGTDNNDGSYIVSAFNVKDYGAVGDGVADDTQAIENTISAMVFGPRTGVIYFPAGKYRVTKPGFNVFANCTVIGQWNDPSSDSEKEETVIIADYVSDKGVPLFYLGACSTVTNISVYYPNQSISKVIAYAPTLSTKSSSGVSNCFVTVRNVTLYNSYSGIDAMGGAQHLSGIYGTVLNSGIKIGSNAEVSEFMNIDFSADYWNSYDGTSSDAIKGYTKSNATAISIGYVDDILVYNVKARAEEFAKGVYFYLEHEARANGCSGIAYGFTYKIDGEISYSGDYDNFNEGWPQMNHLDRIANTERYDYSEPTQRYSGKSALFNVRSSEFGAKGDGKADDTQAFISALKAAGDNGGGIVFVPSGNYVVTQSLTVPSNVEVLGEWYGYRTGSPSRIDMKFEGAGDDALFILSRDSGVQGLTFYIPAHKAQTYVPPTGADYGYGNGESYNVTTDVFPTEHINAKEYPWFIRANGNKCWAENICITNGWNGLDFASAKCDNLAIRGVWGTCMNECINVGGGSEDGKISCVFFTFGTWWESVGRAYDLSLWSYTNVKGVTFGDCKNIQVLSCSTFGLSKGISFVAEGGNKPENISILRSLIDSPYGWVCLDIQAGDKLSYLGVSTGTHPTEDNGRISTAITVGENFDGTARLYGQNIWAGCENVIRGDVVLYSASDTQTEVIDHNFKNPDYSVQVDEQKSGGCGKSQAGLTALVSMGLGILLLNFIKKI